MKSWTLTCS